MSAPERERFPSVLRSMLIVLGVLLVYRLINLELIEPLHGDPMGYWLAARRILEGHEAVIDNHRLVRFALLYPIIAIQWLFGAAPQVYYLVPLVCGVGTCAGLLGIGRTLGAPKAGFFAALVYAVCPLTIEDGSQVFPDPWMGMYMLFAIWAALAATSAHCKRPTLHACLAGAMTFAAWGAKITAVYYLLPLATVFLWRRKHKLLVVWAGMFALCIAGETLVLALILEQPMGRLGMVRSTYGQLGRLNELSSPLELFKRFTRLGPHGELFLPLAAGCGLFVWRRHRFPGVLLLLPLCFLLFITFHVKSFSPLVPGTLFTPRYLSSTTALLCLPIGWALSTFAHGAKGWWPLLVVLGFFLLTPTPRNLAVLFVGDRPHTLSVVEHNERVLNEAIDEGVPILLAHKQRRAVNLGKWVRRIFYRPCCEIPGVENADFPQRGRARVGQKSWNLLITPDLFERYRAKEHAKERCNYIVLSRKRGYLATPVERPCPTFLKRDSSTHL